MDEVYIAPYVGYIKDLDTAYERVADGGTIYIRPHLKDAYNFTPIYVEKDIKIIGITEDGRRPSIFCPQNPLIRSAEDTALHIENLYIGSNNDTNTLLESNSNKLRLNNIHFLKIIPVTINNSSKNSSPIDISINRCTFQTTYPKIDVQSYVYGNISISDNTFIKTPIKILNNSCSLEIHHNTFENSTIAIENNTEDINIYKNKFHGYTCKLLTSLTDYINFYRNSIICSNFYLENSDTYPLEAQQNWWGSKDGPLFSENDVFFTGPIDYNNWSCDENFKHFFHDPKVIIHGIAKLKNALSHNNIDVKLHYMDGEHIKDTSTDIEGHYIFEDIFQDKYTLTFSHDKFQTVSKYVYTSIDDTDISDTQLVYDKGYFDINDNHMVNFDDLNILVDNLHKDQNDSQWHPSWDLNKNGSIDIMDLIIMLRSIENNY